MASLGRDMAGDPRNGLALATPIAGGQEVSGIRTFYIAGAPLCVIQCRRGTYTIHDKRPCAGRSCLRVHFAIFWVGAMTIKNVALTIILLTIGCPIFLLVRYGGLRGALLGARIKKTTGELVCAPTKWQTSRLVVYDLAGNPGRDLGIELQIINAGGNSKLLTAMSAEEARELVALLRVAASGDTPRQDRNT